MKRYVKINSDKAVVVHSTGDNLHGVADYVELEIDVKPIDLEEARGVITNTLLENKVGRIDSLVITDKAFATIDKELLFLALCDSVEVQ